MKLDKSVETRIKNAAPKKQKGASSLEYLMLATVIIVVLGVLAGDDVGRVVKDAFTGLFTDATTPPS